MSKRTLSSLVQTLLLLVGSLLFLPRAEAGLPLEETRVEIDISGPVAEMTVEQTFLNDNEDFIEALYVFPLHQDSAVDAMVMRIGDREIRADIMEREEAREVYEEALESGRSAALVEQERPNVFTQNVANIPPGERIHVILHVVQPLTYEDGRYRFEFPLVVGPRFVPTGVEDAARITPPVSPGDTGHRVSIDLQAWMGFPLADMESISHPEAEIFLDGSEGSLILDGIRADRDFVVELDPDVDSPQASLLVQDGHFSLLVEPPPAPEDSEILPRELIFVVDNSCSMSGTPIQMAKQAMRKALRGLRPGDSFQVIRFSEGASRLSSAPLAATPENIRLGLAYVDQMQGMGGTHMMAGIDAALEYTPTDRKRIVCFMTDGYIGNERQILGAIADKIGSARLFSFGIGSSVNRFLLDRMATVGRGAVTYVLLNESPDGKVDEFYERIARPVLTDIEIDFGDMDVEGIYPKLIPDLFAGQPVRVVGRYRGSTDTVRVSGWMGNGPFSQEVAVEAVDDGSAIGTMWARSRVRSLQDEQHWGEIEAVKAEIIDTALQYDLLTAYTSFVAVEWRVRNPNGAPLTLNQPLETPAGVDFERVFGSELSRRHMRPGDPLLTVDAPPDARDVLVIFPWGELERMRWDSRRERWYVRFLVPRGVEDGVYQIRVLAVMPDGSIQPLSEELYIDSEAPEFDLEATWEGDSTRVTLYAEEPLRSVHFFPPGRPDLRIRVDVRALNLQEGEPVEVVLPGRWVRISVMAKDLALNRIEEQVEVSP